MYFTTIILLYKFVNVHSTHAPLRENIVHYDRSFEIEIARAIWRNAIAIVTQTITTCNITVIFWDSCL